MANLLPLALLFVTAGPLLGDFVSSFPTNLQSIAGVGYSGVGPAEIIIAAQTGIIVAWNPATASIRQFPTYGPITALAIRKSSSNIATAHSGKFVTLWDTAAPSSLFNFTVSPAATFTALDFCQVQPVLAATDVFGSGDLDFWRVDTYSGGTMNNNIGAPMASIAFEPGNTTLYTASQATNSGIRPWLLTGATAGPIYVESSALPLVVCFTGSGEFLSLNSNGWVRTGLTASPGQFQSSINVGNSASTLACHPSDRVTFLIGRSNGSIEWWARNSTLLAAFQPLHTSSITTLAWHPNGIDFVSGSQDGTVRRWNTTNPTSAPVPSSAPTPAPAPAPPTPPSPALVVQPNITNPLPPPPVAPKQQSSTVKIIVIAAGAAAAVLALGAALAWKFGFACFKGGTAALVRTQDKQSSAQAHEEDKAAAVEAARREERDNFGHNDSEEEIDDEGGSSAMHDETNPLQEESENTGIYS